MAADLRQMLEIDYLAFSPNHWAEDDFIGFLSGDGEIRITKISGRVAGYLCSSKIRRGRRIWSIAVHPDFRRQRVGTNLVDAVKNSLQLGGRLVIIVSERDVGSHLFLRSAGFSAVKVKRDHFRINEDGYVFRWNKEGL
jgi:ribosomal protein S18 acetylase RimI-like enzyme